MFKHALIAVTLVATAVVGAPLAAAGDSDSDRERRHNVDVFRNLNGAADRHVVHDRRRGHGRTDDPRPVHNAYAPWHHWQPVAYTRPMHDHRYPGYHCRHCHFRTDSRDTFFHHVHHHHHVPWHDIGAYLAWHPLHVFFSLGAH